MLIDSGDQCRCNLLAQLSRAGASENCPVAVTDGVTSDHLNMNANGAGTLTLDRLTTTGQLSTLCANAPKRDPGSLAPGGAVLAVM